MLGVLFYPRDFGQSPTERLAIPLGALRPRYTQGHTCVTINFPPEGNSTEALRVGRVRDLQRY